ncbi:hypothetical protein [Bartonella sp. CL63NXGY]|uniref:hypothetical protein n=1 Tax=Bartonella sp. CL63NXGY TaxID=3243538 RepID=UPI0035D13681
MSSKLPWTRLFADKWLLDLAYLPAFEGFIYVKLRFQMLRTGEPLTNNFKVLSLLAGCSVKKFQKALDLLLETGHIICLEDGRLWNPDVELELNDSKEKSEAATKAAHSRWHKTKGKNDNNHIKENAYADCMQSAYDAHSVAQCERNAINNNINIYKKNKTNVLLKKEIDFEDLETIDLVDEPIECDVESQSEQTNQPPIHEQTSVPKKAKRVKTDRGCRLPTDFEPDYDFAIREGLPPERVKVEIAKFRDYWNAKAGKDASKRDWQATWRNWVRNSKDHKVNKQGGNYGNYNQKQKSIGERIADSLLDIGNRGYFETHSCDDTSERSVCFEGWQPINETAGIDCFRGL